ncbi:MAG: hypothetical protein ABL864_14020 [Terricaulis sp.]
MTARRPLVVIAGQIQQLPTGDTVDGASGTGQETNNLIVDGGMASGLTYFTVPDGGTETPTVETGDFLYGESLIKFTLAVDGESRLASATKVEPDPEATYVSLFWARRDGLSSGPTAGFVAYDLDADPIYPGVQTELAFHPTAVATTLAANLNPGDTTVTLTDGSSWDLAPAATDGHFMWQFFSTGGYAYQFSGGNPTYCGTHYSGNHQGATGYVSRSGNVLTLDAPWAGPAIASGETLFPCLYDPALITAGPIITTGVSTSQIHVDTDGAGANWYEYQALFAGAGMPTGTATFSPALSVDVVDPFAVTGWRVYRQPSGLVDANIDVAAAISGDKIQQADNDAVGVVRFATNGEAAAGTAAWVAVDPSQLAARTAVTEAEIDFGTTPVWSKSFTVTATGVTTGSHVIVTPSGTVATSRVGDDWAWDGLIFAAVPGTDEFTLTALAVPGPVVGARTVQYQVF